MYEDSLREGEGEGKGKNATVVEAILFVECTITEW
jgi:hypothetical protein